MRVTNAPARKRRHKKYLKMAKGFFGRRKKCWTIVKEVVEHALSQAYVGRKRKKRDYRRLWILRINAAARLRDMSYTEFMNRLSENNIQLNRKMLSNILQDKYSAEALFNAIG